MAAYDRDASLERQQIREISLNVTRRLRQVLDRNHYIPAALRPEVDSTVRVITGIQRDIDQIMAGLPDSEALDFAILTHIMGGQRHALDLLEILEQKLEGGRGAFQRDSTRVHQALLTVSREIEQDALRYAAESQPTPPGPSPAAYAFAPPPPSAPAPTAYPQPPPPAYGGQPQPPPPARRKPPAPRTRQGRAFAVPPALLGLRDVITSLARKPVTVAVAALVVGAGLVIAAQSLIGSDPAPSEPRRTESEAGEPARQAARDTAERTTVAAAAALPGTAASAGLEQPYLVVLATRRSTEELQQDYRTFKGSYPDLLGNAKARVDRVQGQDRNTWYRLSLIPPRTHDDAKTLCSSLRKAGLTGCWIRPVPVN